MVTVEQMPKEFPPLSALADLEEIGCQDVVKCIFNLTETDIAVLNTLSEEEQITASEVASSLKKDRSTAHRSLEKLVACGLCYKERKGGKPRGFTNVYRRIPDNKMYIKAEESLDRCYAKIKGILQDIRK
jgi:predicted transcriptional regulator